jgi:hypothetical protein
MKQCAESDYLAAVFTLYNRVMKLSEEELCEEAAIDSFMKQLVLFIYPLMPSIVCAMLSVSIPRTDGCIAIMDAASDGYYDVVQFLARNKKADLSISNDDEVTIFTLLPLSFMIYRRRRRTLSCVY